MVLRLWEVGGGLSPTILSQPQRPEAREPASGREKQHPHCRLRHGVPASGGQPFGDQLWVSGGPPPVPLRSWLISFRYHTPLRVQCHFLVLTHEKFSIGSGSVTSRSALVRGNSFCWKNTEAPLILVQPLHIWTYCSSIRCPGRWADIH